MIVLDRLFSFGRQRKVVAGRVKQVFVLHSNDSAGIRLSGLSIGHLRRVVI